MMKENLADFFDFSDSGLAELVLLGPVGSEVEIAAYFDDASLDERDKSLGANRSFSFEISTTQPMLTCMAADVDEVSGGDRVVVNSVEYVVADYKPNGTGIAKIPLYLK